MVRASLLLLALPPLLAACGETAPPPPPAERDPAVAAALALPLLSDPDLAGTNPAGAALTGGGPPVGVIPLIPVDPASAEAARSAARQLLGGSIPALPRPVAEDRVSPVAAAPTAAAVAAALSFSRGCAAELDYSFSWAARLPAALPVYPLGEAQEAGGNDRPGCKLRVVNFRVPVSADEVIAFYRASAIRAGLTATFRRAGGDAVLTGGKIGGKGAFGYAVFARPLPDGQAEVDLIVNG